jgi:hypothetical protein
MKLFKTLSALAVVRAQVPDFADLNALFASLTDNLAVAPAGPAAAAAPADGEAIDGARYVVATQTTTPATTTTTQPPTTTTVQTQGTGCWKCDRMNFLDCATSGEWTTCSPDQTAGDYGVCFLELREQNQLLTQLCTGCKSRNSCDNLKRQNFVGSDLSARMGRFHDQCKPEWKLQRGNRRYGVQQSVCRTCFHMCSQAEDHKCFGGLEAVGTVNGEFFKYDLNMNTGSSTGATKTYWYQNANDAVVTVQNLGIPLGIFADTTATKAQVSAMTNMVNWGGDYGDTGSGKQDATGRGSNGATTATMGLYWAIQDQTKAWWSQDLTIAQSAYQANAATDDLVARLNAAAEFTGLTDLI